MKDLDFDLDGVPSDWVDAGGGVKRKILVYNDQIMMVCHRYVKGGVGPLHQHPHVQASIVISGKFELTRAGRTMSFGPGDSILMPSGVPHGALCVETGDMIEIFSPLRKEFV